jgi:hypothetical protein
MQNTGDMTHGSSPRTCTCMRRIAADMGSHASIGEQHQVAEEAEFGEFVPGSSMTSYGRAASTLSRRRKIL